MGGGGQNEQRKLKIVHCCGSPVSQYYSMISVHYCRQMLAGASDDATKAAFDFTFAVVRRVGDGARPRR